MLKPRWLVTKSRQSANEEQRHKNKRYEQKKSGATTALTGGTPVTETRIHPHRDGRLCQSLAVTTRPSNQNDYVKKGFSRKSHSYKLLPLEFQSHGFSYRQIAREGDVAIYEQGRQDSDNVCYEVIRIRRVEARTFPSGRSYPAREVYPASETWGTYGFTVLSKDAAFEKLKQLSLSPGSTGKPNLDNSLATYCNSELN